jgi:hypothetical protein
MWYLSLFLLGFFPLLIIVTIIDLKAAHHLFSLLGLSFFFKLILLLVRSERRTVLLFISLFLRLDIVERGSRTEFVGGGWWERGFMSCWEPLMLEKVGAN